MPNPADGVELAEKLDARLRKLLAGDRGWPHGWATRAVHIQTYVWLAGLLEKLQAALSSNPVVPPDEYQPGDGKRYTDGRVMLLAQQIALILDNPGDGYPKHATGSVDVATRLIASLKDALKASGSK